MKYILFLILIGVILYFSFLGLRGLCEPDEGRYAEIAREMVESNDFMEPRLNYIKHFHKPPIVYWLVSISFFALGINESTARLPVALIAILGLIVTFYIAVYMGRTKKSAFLSSLVLATSFQYFVWSQILAADMIFSFFIYLALFGFWRWHKGKGSVYIFYLGLALAFMGKGPVSIVITTLVIITYLGITKQWNVLRRMKLLSGFILFFVLVGPWFIYVCIKNPDLAKYFIFNQSLNRLVTTSHGREGHILYFIPILFIGFLPWIFFLPSALMKYKPWKKTNSPFLFTFLWIILPVLFFSMSSSKLPGYILPIYPALAIIVGSYIYDKGFYKSFTVICIIASIIYISGTVVLPEIEEKLGDNLSIRKVANYINNEGSSSDKIVNYRCFFQGLPFYMNRRVILVEKGREMQFENGKGEHINYMFSNYKDFEEQLQENEQFWCFSPIKDYQDLLASSKVPLYKIWQESGYVLVSNIRPKTKDQTF